MDIPSQGGQPVQQASAVPQNTAPAPAPAPIVNQLSYNSLRTRNMLGFDDGLLDIAFRFGFSTVFLINALTALVDPGGFLKLIEGNFVARMFGHYQLQLYAIAINDFILGILIFVGFRRKLVYAWAGIWLMIVTFFKFTSLV